jgi:hypothetical protein
MVPVLILLVASSFFAQERVADDPGVVGVRGQGRV